MDTLYNLSRCDLRGQVLRHNNVNIYLPPIGIYSNIYNNIDLNAKSPAEYFSARISKKDRKATIVEELLADQKSQAHFKKKYNEIQEQAASGGRKWYRQLKDRRKRRK
jgi:hypothetical protein